MSDTLDAETLAPDTLRHALRHVFCVWLNGSMLPERSKDEDNIQQTADAFLKAASGLKICPARSA